jgi:DNA polymerase-3 subunit alpha
METLFGDKKRELIPTSPFDENEKLRYEQEAYGFFFSSHPLSQYEKLSEALFTPSTKLKEFPTNKLIITGGAITKVDKKTSKKNRRWAKLRVEDENGSFDVLVFPKLFEEYGSKLDSLGSVVIKGRIKADSMSNQVQISAENIMPLEQIENHLKCAYLILDLGGVGEEDITGVKKVLSEHSGKIPLTILCRNEYEEIRLKSKDIKIKPDEKMIQKIHNIIGEGSLRFSI